jgi:hypothetical protein
LSFSLVSLFNHILISPLLFSNQQRFKEVGTAMLNHRTDFRSDLIYRQYQEFPEISTAHASYHYLISALMALITCFPLRMQTCPRWTGVHCGAVNLHSGSIV